MTVRRVRLRHKLQPDNITARMTVQDITMWLATAAGAYGLSLMEGKSIWVGHAYDTARLLPGSPQSWGAILLASAALIGMGMFTGRRTVLLTGITGAMLWNLFFALSFLKEYIELRVDDVPGAPLGLGACITYLGISGVFALLTSTYREKNATSSNTP
ncbi:membrane protein [Gordonia phage Sidious]|uniref:Membrane protein n=1 Tax=Gordonia phage Sidious TaxID=2591118 RepID=A0A515MI86_9CAUD|nr:membrane protein [Gordonia phage Sidious]QDM56370.1 membrane protein [Gordonia phage Sidious]